MKIRIATKKDLREISRLNYKYNKYENKLDKNIKMSKLKDIEKQDKLYFDLGTLYFVVEFKGEIRGVLGANLERRGKEKAGVLHTLIVSEKVRRKGYGQELVKFVLNYFKENGCRRVRTFIHIANKNAKSFWIKNKFELEEGYYATRMLK